MSIKLYDDAIANKIRKWVLDPKVRILKPDETQRFFEMTLDQQKDQALTLPLITIARHRNIEISNTQKQPKTFSGISLLPDPKKPYDPDATPPETSILLNAIPIKLGYQIDIYARFMEEADEYLRNFTFNLINHPRLTINIPYNGTNVPHRSILNLDPTLSDNSDIKEHMFADQFTRFTMNVYVQDAYFFSAPEVQNSILEGIEVWMHEKHTGKNDDYLVASEPNKDDLIEQED